jgi:3-deoxy-manno-octulosonate cytidylyltransferase (CMP-KDO synthetase)
MQAVGIIPARFGSTRLAQKMLIKVCGKSIIQRTYENAIKSKKLSDVIVATDDERIMAEVESFSGKAMLTDVNHVSGTDRIAEVAAKVPADVYVNIQGDEPLIDGNDIDKLIESFNDNNVDIATLAYKINAKEAKIPDVVKVITDKNDFALYFSRSVIPFDRDNVGFDIYYKHIGIYAYKKDILFNYVALPVSELENAEKLEQLRALQEGYKIKVILTENETIAIDVKEDIDKLEDILKGRDKKNA